MIRPKPDAHKAESVVFVEGLVSPFASSLGVRGAL